VDGETPIDQADRQPIPGLVVHPGVQRHTIDVQRGDGVVDHYLDVVRTSRFEGERALETLVLVTEPGIVRDLVKIDPLLAPAHGEGVGGPEVVLEQPDGEASGMGGELERNQERLVGRQIGHDDAGLAVRRR